MPARSARPIPSSPPSPVARPVPPKVRAFRVVAMVEAVSYLVLVAAAISRRTTDLADLVPVIGPIHGVIFLVYFGLALVVRGELRWSVRTTAVVVLASIVPLGGFLVERRLLPHGGHGGGRRMAPTRTPMAEPGS